MSVESAYLEWARETRLPHIIGVEACLIRPEAQALHQGLSAAGWAPSAEPLATLVGMRAFLQSYRHRGASAGFVAAWAQASRQKASSVDINESRFVKWAQAEDWDAFLDHSITGARVILAAGHKVDLGAFCNCVRARDEDAREFGLEALSEFYSLQPSRWPG